MRVILVPVLGNNLQISHLIQVVIAINQSTILCHTYSLFFFQKIFHGYPRFHLKILYVLIMIESSSLHHFVGIFPLKTDPPLWEVPDAMLCTDPPQHLQNGAN